MTTSLKRTTEPVLEPVLVEELKKSLHITHSEQDSTLEEYLLAGRQKAEDYQRRSFITQTWDIVLDSYPTGEICLLRGPVQSLTSVIVTDVDGDETTMDLTDFIVLTDGSPARMLLKSTAYWPDVDLQEIGGIRIRYVTGYGLTGESVPADTKHAIIVFASFTDDNRGVEDTVTPEAFFNLLETNRLYEVSPV